MPIEFACSQCGKQLRTPDDTAGKQAKCPQCGAVMQIPMAGSFGPPPLPPADDPASFNPYASPSAGVPPANTMGTASAGEIVHSRADLGQVLASTWAVFRSRLGDCALAGVLLLILAIVFVGVAVVAMFGAAILQGGGPREPSIVGQIAVQLISAAVYAFMFGGIVTFFLKIARGQQAAIGDLFSGAHYFVTLFQFQLVFALLGVIPLLAQLAFGAGIVSGMLSLATSITSFVLYLILALTPALIVDRKLTFGDAASQSIALMNGNKMTYFLVNLVVGLGGGVALLLSCGLGVVFVIPFTTLSQTVFYLHATGQLTADRATPTL